MTIVTRFPPSPTGLMHIGTARTLLYNWLYARGRGGKVVFRIEDTDRNRYDPAHVDALINGVKWLGLDYDGDVISQYERRDRHAEVARELLKAGKAYYCYCTPEELDAMREKAKAEGSYMYYDRRWRDSKEQPPEGVSPTIRIKAPIGGDAEFPDLVEGGYSASNDTLDDFIILRSDGTPTYMLAVVVDDHDMGVTHVIRGNDHVHNTFRQNLIYRAMGWDEPTYAHLPLIYGPDGTKMSKRHGAASVEEYRDMGYLPEAMLNYLLRLGWSHGNDEIISMEQALEWFDFDHVNNSPARFDFDKLNHLNAHYIKLADNARLLDLIQSHLEMSLRGAVGDAAIHTSSGLFRSARNDERILAMMDELKSRAVTLVQLADEAAFLVKSVPLDFSEAALKLLDADAKGMLAQLAVRFAALDPFTHDKIEECCRALATDTGAKLGKVMMPLRAALTGRDKSPSLFHAAEVLGKDETLARIKGVL